MTSRLTVEGERPNPVAIARNDRSTAKPREISSRSANVSDGAVIPRPLGVNPLLTISALAERCCALLAQDRGATIDYTLPSVPPAPAAPRALGIQFSGTMKGYLSAWVTGDYQAAADRGKADDSRFEFTLTIISDDLDRMLADPMHQARLIGTVKAPALSPDPIT